MIGFRSARTAPRATPFRSHPPARRFPRPPLPHQRDGLSLLEVVISLAILFSSIAVLGQLLDAARVGALRAALETEATLMAESLLAELVAAEVLPSGVTDSPIGDDPDWTYSLEIESTEWESLTSLTITVQHRNAVNQIDAEVKLSRWLYVSATPSTEGESSL